jgi:hypothetical protein
VGRCSSYSTIESPICGDSLFCVIAAMLPMLLLLLLQQLLTFDGRPLKKGKKRIRECYLVIRYSMSATVVDSYSTIRVIGGKTKQKQKLKLKKKGKKTGIKQERMHAGRDCANGLFEQNSNNNNNNSNNNSIRN